MRHKTIGKSVILLTIFIILSDSLMAQRRGRSRTRDREPDATEQLAQWYSISLGTLGFGSGFSISGKFSYALKFEDRVSVGAFGKTFYDLINNFNAPDESLFSYGAGGFARLNITEEIFIHGEYNYTSFEEVRNAGRRSLLYPSIGGGYKAGYDNWTYGFHILLPLDEEARDFVNLEYWIDFNYNF